jgi:hypothetical protein
MAVENGLFMLLTEDAGVSAQVASRVYWILPPKGATLPYLVLSRSATTDTYNFQGATGLRDGLFQIDVYASDYYSARSISQVVRQLLESYIGNMLDTNATAVIGSMVEKDWDMPFEEGGTGFVYRCLLEISIHYYDSSLPVSTPSNPIALIDGGTATGDDTIL